MSEELREFKRKINIYLFKFSSFVINNLDFKGDISRNSRKLKELAEELAKLKE